MKRFWPLLILLLLLVPAQAPAPPRPPLRTPFTFALYGDAREGHDVHRSIIAGILASDAKFVVQTGDLAYLIDDDAELDAWRAVSRELRRRMPYYPAKGNHDVGVKGRFEREFGLDSPWYDRVEGPIHFFFLDSNRIDEAQTAWLRRAAGASTAPHRIAVMHHPGFTLIPWRDLEAAATRARFHDLLRELGFLAVFCGHDHQFYTTVRDGLRYVVSGGGGAPLYEQDPTRAGAGDRFRVFHHYVLVFVEETRMTARVFGADGVEDPSLTVTVWER